MKIIKVFLILFPMIVGISIGGVAYFDNLASKVNMPDNCKLFCFPDLDACTIETYENIVKKPDKEGSIDNYLGYILDKTKACKAKLKPKCEACNLKNKPFISKATSTKQKYNDYGDFSTYSAAAFGTLTLLTIIAYLAVKFSVVRTMAAVSIIWIAVSVSENYRIGDILLTSSPVFLYWLYRFIRYGPSKMLKDKT